MLAVTAALYAPSIGYGFVYEDLNDPATSFQPWSWELTRQMPLRSLTQWLHTFCLWIGAGAAWPYHAAGVALHLLNVTLLALLAGPLAAAVFAWHPLNVESVAYVSSRPDVLAVSFVLLALLAERRGWWVLAALACGAATLSKESAVVAWALVPFAAWWTGRSFPRWWVDIVALPVGLIAGRMCWNCGAMEHWPLRLSLDGTMQTLGTVSTYGAWTLAPVGLSILHDWTWLTPAASVGLVAVAGSLVFIARAWFAAAWVLLALAPRVLVAYGDGLHDHHWYLPMVGICLAVGTWTKARS